MWSYPALDPLEVGFEDEIIKDNLESVKENLHYGKISEKCQYLGHQQSIECLQMISRKERQKESEKLKKIPEAECFKQGYIKWSTALTEQYWLHRVESKSVFLVR